MHLRKGAGAHSSYTRGPACVAVPARGPGRRAACAGPLWSSCRVTVGPPPASPRARLAFHSVTREVPRTVISTLHDAIPANPQRPRLRDVYASARPWPWIVAFPKLSSAPAVASSGLRLPRRVPHIRDLTNHANTLAPETLRPEQAERETPERALHALVTLHAAARDSCKSHPLVSGDLPHVLTPGSLKRSLLRRLAQNAAGGAKIVQSSRPPRRP